MRDPRLNPMTGDIIKQNKSGLLVKVLNRNGDGICFCSLKKNGQEKEPVTWNINGWKNMVCDDSSAVTIVDA